MRGYEGIVPLAVQRGNVGQEMAHDAELATKDSGWKPATKCGRTVKGLLKRTLPRQATFRILEFSHPPGTIVGCFSGFDTLL